MWLAKEAIDFVRVKADNKRVDRAGFEVSCRSAGAVKASPTRVASLVTEAGSHYQVPLQTRGKELPALFVRMCSCK